MGAAESHHPEVTKENFLEPVYLHVYDFGDSTLVRGLNVALRGQGSGAYHVGVEVYGQEWTYAGKGNFGSTTHSKARHRSGISCCVPRQAEGHTYRETVFMGYTSMTKVEIVSLTESLGEYWRSEDYDIIARNCCHFCDHFCRHIGVEHIPEMFKSLAAMGRMLLGSPDSPKPKLVSTFVSTPIRLLVQ